MPGGVINTGSHPKLLWPGIHAIWGQVYAEHMTQYTDLYNVETSGKAYEEDVEVTGFGLAPIKPEGEPLKYDSELQGSVIRAVHIAYALGYQVTLEELDDNLYEQVSRRRAKANAFSMSQTIENVATFLWNDAFNGTYFTTGDGQPLLSASHANPLGGTYSNLLSPAADLSEASLEDAVIQLMGATNSRGLNISVQPSSLHVARQEWFNANRIMKAVLQPNTNSNNPNIIRALNTFPGGVKLNTYFNNPHAWFIRTNVQNGPTLYWRRRPFFDKDNDFATKNALASSYMRLSVTVTDPKSVFGSNGP